MQHRENEIDNALLQLKRGNTILYPTETVWGIGCDATNDEAVSKIYTLKQREESKALICLVSDFKMLNMYIEDIPEVAYDILKYSNKPTTIIYEKPRHIAPNLVAADNTIAIRVTDDPFCKRLIRKLKRPIVSTSANISNQKTPKSFKEISPEIINGVDYVVDFNQKKKSSKPSTIIQLKANGEIKIIRE